MKAVFISGYTEDAFRKRLAGKVKEVMRKGDGLTPRAAAFVVGAGFKPALIRRHRRRRPTLTLPQAGGGEGEGASSHALARINRQWKLMRARSSAFPTNHRRHAYSPADNRRQAARFVASASYQGRSSPRFASHCPYYSTDLSSVDEAIGGGLFAEKLYGVAAQKKMSKALMMVSAEFKVSEIGVI